MTLTVVGVLLWPCLAGPCIWRWAEAYRRRYAAEWSEPFTPQRGLTGAEWCFGFLAALSLLPGLAAGRSLIGTLVLCGLGLLASLCDARYGVLPRRLSLLLFLAGGAESIVAGHFLSALAASFLAVVVAGVLYGLARGGMGQGDIWYYAALATWLSPLQTLLLLWLAALLGACFGILSCGFSSRRQAIPFGPFLTLAVGLATPVGSWLGYG
ncbi:MAG: prepilin peptidase [Negativicoccus succinicivorans]|uniref:prepilin peptidase n=1 Tax=Negativicoccus succinicivorans TaxID=620903 RepID=UPI0026EADFCE|nr:A24 family peptidase [Negativicoccus succinicivorans]MBS6028195.1 prepilin peptidase [Negativicoccus succinicivorans]